MRCRWIQTTDVFSLFVLFSCYSNENIMSWTFMIGGDFRRVHKTRNLDVFNPLTYSQTSKMPNEEECLCFLVDWYEDYANTFTKQFFEKQVQTFVIGLFPFSAQIWWMEQHRCLILIGTNDSFDKTCFELLSSIFAQAFRIYPKS